MLVGRPDEGAQVVERAELRMDRRVAALAAADRPWHARVVATGRDHVVGTLAKPAPDWVDRRQVEHVEAHLGDVRQAGDDVAQGAVPAALAGRRPRKQLVPG